MPKGVFIGFDFGFRRIGMAVGQLLTCTANPLPTLIAQSGNPDWNKLSKIIEQWNPEALIVGLPTCIDDSELYTTGAAKSFAKKLKKHFNLPIHFVDERLSTVEARERLYAQGGYRKIKNTEIDGIAACIILEQWLHYPSE